MVLKMIAMKQVALVLGHHVHRNHSALLTTLSSLQVATLTRGAVHSADYAVARCPPVCLSVCPSHVGILSKQLKLSLENVH